MVVKVPVSVCWSDVMTQQLERRYTNEFLQEKMANKHYTTRQWLGPLPPGKEAAMYMVTGRWADAIVFEPDKTTIIEFKLEPDPKAIGQLDLYEKLFKQTLRFSEYWRLPVYKMLVTTRIDEPLLELCREHAIEYNVFHPDWVEYWEKRRFKL